MVAGGTGGASGEFQTYGKFRRKTLLNTAWRSALISYGYLLALLELVNGFFPAVRGQGLPLFGAALLVGALVGLARGHAAQAHLGEVCVAYGSGNGLEVRVVVGDFMDNLRTFDQASCAFGVNDTFATEGLRANSVHQQFLDEYLADLDGESRQVLHDQALVSSGLAVPAGQGGGRASHAHGSVACLEFGRRAGGGPRHAFLLVNSGLGRYDFKGRALTAPAIRRVWEFHCDAADSDGLTTDELLFALVGTGNSKDLTPIASVVTMIDAYFDHLEQVGPTKALVRRLVISIPPKVVEDGRIDLEAVHEYLRARCKVSMQQNGLAS